MDKYDISEYSYKNGYVAGVKDLANRLKEMATSTFFEQLKYVSTEDIDNIVKEMVGDN